MAAFRRLHDKVVHGVNVSSVTDYLFSVGVISADDYHTFVHVSPVVPPVEQCRRLMSILYTSGNPAAFVELREALSKEMAYRWLVNQVDEQFEQIVASSRSEPVETTSFIRQVLNEDRFFYSCQNIKHSISQSINQSINQSVSQSITISCTVIIVSKVHCNALPVLLHDFGASYNNQATVFH